MQMDSLTETFDELNLGCEKALSKQFNEGGIKSFFYKQALFNPSPTHSRMI